MLESAFSSFWAQEYAGFELTLNREDRTWGLNKHEEHYILIHFIINHCSV
jgi:hypothetical protein